MQLRSHMAHKSYANFCPSFTKPVVYFWPTAVSKKGAKVSPHINTEMFTYFPFHTIYITEMWSCHADQGYAVMLIRVKLSCWSGLSCHADQGWAVMLIRVKLSHTKSHSDAPPKLKKHSSFQASWGYTIDISIETVEKIGKNVNFMPV